MLKMGITHIGEFSKGVRKTFAPLSLKLIAHIKYLTYSNACKLLQIAVTISIISTAASG